MAHHFTNQHLNLNSYSSSPASSVSSYHTHHAGRSRRAPRLPASQHSQKQFRGVKSMKELTEAASLAAFRARFEAGRSFDLDDDLEFCPALLTEDDLQYISSPSSDRSSLSSRSPDSSPTQHQVQPNQHATPSLAPTTNSPSHATTHFQHLSHMKLHQPAAMRARSAIPIVNPNTGMRLPSPPHSISPGMSGIGRRW